MVLIGDALVALAFIVFGVAMSKFLNTQSRDREAVDVTQRIRLVDCNQGSKQRSSKD